MQLIEVSTLIISTIFLLLPFATWSFAPYNMMNASSIVSRVGMTIRSQNSAVTKLAQELIRIPSITPKDLGCQDIIRQRLERLGFICETLRYDDEVTNLWCHLPQPQPPQATVEDRVPLVVFLGHTDVVPTGPHSAWKHPPFEATVVEDPTTKDEVLYGRGAVDMKGGVAAFVIALERFLLERQEQQNEKDKQKEITSDLPFSIGVLLTSDEEGPAIHGSEPALTELQQRGTVIDMAIVGEPSSLMRVGDVIKVGRRGSLSGDLSIHGIQGHVAYPHLARNPIHESLGALKEMVDEVWDEGTDNFPPTSFQISNIQSGTGALNLIPGFKTVQFNFRFSPASTDQQLKERIEAIIQKHELDYNLEWSATSYPFETRGGELVEETMQSVKDVMKYSARPCTSGGTSDGRFVAVSFPEAQIVELGLLNASIHQINERTRVADLESLSEIYGRLLYRLQLAEERKRVGKRKQQKSAMYQSHVDVQPLP